MRMKLLTGALFLAFGVTAQQPVQIAYFDKDGDLTTEDKFSRERTCQVQDSLILVQEFDRNGRRTMSGEYLYNERLLQDMLQRYGIYCDDPDLKGITTVYHRNGTMRKVDVVRPFEHAYRRGVSISVDTAGLGITPRTNSSYVFEYRKDGTIYMEGLNVNGDAFDGQRHGRWMVYDRDGLLSVTIEYQYGRRHGSTVHYVQGRMAYTQQYADDLKVGRPVSLPQ